MKIDVQKSVPRKNRVFRGQADEKATRADVLPVATEQKMPADVAEVVQLDGPRKGNRAMSNDLEVKADELERLFAEHKVRSASVPRRRPVRLPSATSGDVKSAAPADHVFRLPNSGLSKEGSTKTAEFDARVLMKVSNNEDDGSSSMLDDLGSSKTTRGKYYEKYMQIRDAKLGEEWRSKGAVKEAQLMAMQEQLEHCRALMKAGLRASSFRQSGDLQRAAKQKTISACPTIPNKQQMLEFSKSVVVDDPEDLSEEMESDQDPPVNGTLSGSSKSQCPISILSSRNATSCVSKTPAISIPRSTTKPINSDQGITRMHPEILLAKSAPNTSDSRKENGGRISKIKPVTKLNNNHSKSKSATINIVQDDYSGRPQSVGRSFDAVGLNNVLSINSENSMAMPPLQIKSVCRSVQKVVESKPFLRKGKGIGPGAGAAMAKLKASVALENLNNKEEPEGFRAETDGWSRQTYHGGDESKVGSAEGSSMTNNENCRPSSSRTINHEGDELKIESAEEAFNAKDENYRLSIGSGGNPDSEYNDVIELNPQIQDSSLPTIITFTGSKSSTMLESPVGSPTSWYSNLQHPFARASQASDVDAFVDSPVGSSASGNFYLSDEIIDSDDVWMRTESSIGHKHIIAGSPHQSKINVTKGFKRLLKFGKKSKVDDILVNDWVSSSTNVGGDNNIEGSCDQGRQMSDHAKKSRMELIQHPSSYGDPNVGDISNEQGEFSNSSSPFPPDDMKLRRERHPSGSYPKTPRSFFSLSTFRSKGSRPKLR